MPLAAKAPLFSPGIRVILTALKWSGTSVTVGNLVAATTVRVIAGGAGVVCAVAEASATAPSSCIPIVLNHMIASQFKGIIRALYALPAALETAGGFEFLTCGANTFRSCPCSNLHRAEKDCSDAREGRFGTAGLLPLFA